jgi:hypothetical protein
MWIKRIKSSVCHTEFKTRYATAETHGTHLHFLSFVGHTRILCLLYMGPTHSLTLYFYCHDEWDPIMFLDINKLLLVNRILKVLNSCLLIPIIIVLCFRWQKNTYFISFLLNCIIITFNTS